MVTAAESKVLAQLRRKRVATSVTSTTTLTSADQYIRCNASGGAFTVTLAPASEMSGETVVLKKIENGANAVTVAASGTETIDGAASTNLAGGAYSKVTLRSSGTSWDIIA